MYQGHIHWKIPPPPPGGGKISADVMWGKNIRRCHLGEKISKGEEKKGANVKEKGRKGKENGERGSKRAKQLQNREELRQKGHDRH